MPKLSKKALFVKRSLAAKKGWQTRQAIKRSEAAKQGWESRRESQRSTDKRKSGANKKAKTKSVAVKQSRSPARKPSRPAHGPSIRGDRGPKKKTPLRKSRSAIARVKAEAARKIAAIQAAANRKVASANSKTKAATQRLKADKQRQAAAKKEAQKERRRESRERSEIRKANEKALKSMSTAETMVVNMARNGVTIPNILKQIPKSGHEAAKKIIIQTRLDMSAALYEDVRWEAFDLADELDWDISDVFDAWDYDMAAAA